MAVKHNFGSDILSVLKQASADALLGILNSISGSKDLVIDDDLMCSLDHIAYASELKACNVEKIFKLEPGASPGTTSRCVYLVRSVIKTTKIIADHINANRHSGSHNNYWIIFVPRKLHLCDLILEREGVYGYVTILEFPLGFIPLDTDLFSLELADFFPSFYLDGDQTYVHTAALSLVQLQKLCGTIPNVYGQGRCAFMVIELMKVILKETKCQSSEFPQITHMVIVDRDIDYASVLLSQLTYEGLLDETFGINCGKVSFGKEVTGKDKIMKIVLNSSDTIFNEIRNNYFLNVFGHLSEKAKILKAKRDELDNIKGLSVCDMKNLVANDLKVFVQHHSSLSLHIGACEVIMNQKSEKDFQQHLTTEQNLLEGMELKECMTYIEEIINKQLPLLNSLRLLCLLSITQDGLATKDYRSLIVQFLQSHGQKHMLTFQNLKKLGLFVEQVPSSFPGPVSSNVSSSASKIAGKMAAAVVSFPRRSSFKVVSKKLALIPRTDENNDLKNPNDMSYVYNGAYIPLVGKLTEQLIQNDGFQKIEEVVKLLPGATINYKSVINTDRASISGCLDQHISKVVLVYFLGGVTYAEVAALRFLGKIKGYHILIATTSLINGNSLLKSLTARIS